MNVLKKTPVERVGKLIRGEGGFRQHLALDIADVLVDRAVPDDAEDIAEAVVSKLGKTDAAAKLQNMVPDKRVDFRGAEMLLELFPRLAGKPEGPRHVGRTAEGKRLPDNFSWIHSHADKLSGKRVHRIRCVDKTW